MNGVIKAAAELQRFCDSHRWRFCLIGGMALQRWGEPRETVDVDLTLFAGFENEDQYIDSLLGRFKPRIAEAAAFARERRVLLLTSAEGVGLDIALGALPFEALMIERSSLFKFPPATELRTCSAEDLIVLKAFASRNQDWVDVEKIIVRQTGKLDWDHIYEQLRPLAELKEAPQIVDQLRLRRTEFES
jgi:hypothetical protein